MGIIYKDDHKGNSDWQFTLINQCITNAELRKKQVFWQHCLKTFFTNGLNEREEFYFITSWQEQNIFCFINPNSVVVVLTNCYYYFYSPSSFIIIITIVFIITIIYYLLSII